MNDNTKISSYGKIWSAEHIMSDEAYKKELDIEEKVDGSQLSACKLEDGSMLFRFVYTNVSQLERYFETESCLGGSKIEGVVAKARGHFNSKEGKTLKIKLVRPDFKELNKEEWKNNNPGQNSIITKLSEKLQNENRYLKSVQRLKEQEKINGEMQDMPLLLKELNEDLEQEFKDEICRNLIEWGWPEIKRKANKGVALWYKNYLLEQRKGLDES